MIKKKYSEYPNIKNPSNYCIKKINFTSFRSIFVTYFANLSNSPHQISIASSSLSSYSNKISNASKSNGI